MNPIHTDEEILEAARACTTRAEFWKNFSTLYSAAYRRGLIPKIYEFLPESPGLQPAYTDQELIDSARMHPHRFAWRDAGIKSREQGKPSHWGCAIKRGKAFMQICCAHMSGSPRPPRKLKYTDQQLIDSAKKYQHKGQWKKGDYNHYQAAKSRPEVFKLAIAHMTPDSHPYSGAYTIYAYEFFDNTAYVGLTFRPQQRHFQHMQTGCVYRHSKKCPNPILKQLEVDLKNPQEASDRENFWIGHYREQGWRMLNTSAGGSLGTVRCIQWTKEAVLTDAKRYTYRKEWLTNSQVAYRVAKQNDWFEIATAHMPLRDTRSMIGRSFSEETRQRMSESATLRTSDPAWKAEHSAKVTGKHQAEESREKVRHALAGKPNQNRETKARQKQELLAQRKSVLEPLVKAGMSVDQMFESVRHQFGLTHASVLYRILHNCGLGIPGRVDMSALTPEQKHQRQLEKYQRSYQKHRLERIEKAKARKIMTNALSESPEAFDPVI